MTEYRRLGGFDLLDLDIETAALDVPAGIDDNDLFNISGTSLRKTTSADFETKSSYTVTVRVSDGALTYDEQFALTITDEIGRASCRERV